MSEPAATVTAEQLAESPAWLPLETAARDRLRMVRLDEAAYRAASFLDQRILLTHPEEGTCTMATAAASASRLEPRAHYIFHIGHVGSTLLSRLVGEYPAFFSVREPAPLRVIATAPARAFGALELPALLALLARTWSPRQRAVIKATSFVSEIAEPILGASGDARAVLVFSSPLAYLRCILGGPNSRVESRTLAPSRLARLRSRLGSDGSPEPQSEGEAIAMSWLSEMTALRRTAAGFGPRILWVDFDAFLAAPAAGLDRILRALGAAPELREIEALLAGPWLRRYSKAPEHAYDAALRRMVLESADREHGAEVRRGMEWLERLAGRHPEVGAALGATAGQDMLSVISNPGCSTGSR